MSEDLRKKRRELLPREPIPGETNCWVDEALVIRCGSRIGCRANGEQSSAAFADKDKSSDV